MTRRVKPGYSYDKIIAAFDIFHDLSGGCSDKGTLHIDDLVKLLCEYGSEELGQLTEDRARQLVLQMDPNQAGFVNYKEFVDMMMNW